jgi:hypothetical protein
VTALAEVAGAAVMADFVVLKQIPSGPCADSWDTTYVDVTADTPEAAIESVAVDEHKGGEGRYIAIPNEWWVAQNVAVKRIAEVTLDREEMV